MAFTNEWNEATPVAGDDANTLHTIIQNVKKLLRERLNVSHDATDGDDTDTYAHKTFTGRIGSDVDASKPAAAAANLDKVYWSTDTGVVAMSDGTAWHTIATIYHTDGTGSVDVTNGSPTVTGTATNFSRIAAGDIFWVSGATRYYSIASQDTAIQITLDVDYEGIDAANQDYFIGRVTGTEQFLPRAGGDAYDTTIYGGVLGDALDANAMPITGLEQADANGEAVAYPVGTDELEALAVTVAKLAAGLAGEMKIGNYTGDDNDNRTIAAGIDLSGGTWVVGAMSTFGSLVIKTSTMGTSSYYNSAGGDGYIINLIQAGVATGFQIGDNVMINNNGTVYHYFVIKVSS